MANANHCQSWWPSTLAPCSSLSSVENQVTGSRKGSHIAGGSAGLGVTIRLPARPQSVQPSSPSPHSTNVILLFDGLNLHLSSRSATGYENVTIRRSRPNRPYRAKAPGGKLLGDFCSAIEAAVCYARHMHASLSPLSCVPQTATIATGEIIHLHLSVRSLTGYRGV